MSVPRHTIYNMAGAAVPILVSLATVPLYLARIGLDRYGVLAICWLILGYFNIFDFGLGRAASQSIAALAEAPARDRSRIFWASARVSGALTLVAMVLLAPACKLALDQIKVPTPALRGEFDAALPWLVACLPLGLLNSLLNGALTGRREFLKVNLLGTVGSTATALFPLLAAVAWGPNLSHLIAAALTARLLTAGLLVAACRRAVPLLKPERPLPGEMRRLVSFGGWITVSNIIGPILAFWDRFLIGALLGSAAVALYVVPFNLVWQIVILPGSLTSAMFPLLALAGPEERERLSRRALGFLSLIMTPALLGGLIVLGPFLHVWLGSEKGAASAPVGYLLLLGLWTNSFALVPAARLEAQAKPGILARLHLAEVLPYVALLYPAVIVWGIRGAAVVWSLRCAVDTLLLFRLSRERMPPTIWVEALFVSASAAVALFTPLGLPLRWILMLLLFAAGSAFVVWRHPEEVREVREAGAARVRAVLRREPQT